jgi:hypothetical protein
MQTAELATQLPTYGREIKFTPERIQQIRNLVERGKSREEIAELIGVAVRSLKVTCSRLAISVRRHDSSHPPPTAGAPDPNGKNRSKNSGKVGQSAKKPQLPRE